VAFLAPPHFPFYLINGTTFGKKSLNIKFVLIFSTTFIWTISHSRKKSARKIYKCKEVLSDFNENWIFSTNFWKNLNIRFHKNPSSGSRDVSCGWTDGRTKAETDKKLIVAFRNFANAPKNKENICIALSLIIHASRRVWENDIKINIKIDLK
jgi:hypothetical protein